MENQFYRVTLDDSAVKLRARPADVEFDESQLAEINEKLPTSAATGLQVVAFEKVGRQSDFDMDDSRN